jgi:hypothetical protein
VKKKRWLLPPLHPDCMTFVQLPVPAKATSRHFRLLALITSIGSSEIGNLSVANVTADCLTVTGSGAGATSGAHAS